jgi:hypothetical protein
MRQLANRRPSGKFECRFWGRMLVASVLMAGIASLMDGLKFSVPVTALVVGTVGVASLMASSYRSLGKRRA